MIAEQLEKLQAAVTVAQEGQSAAERDKDQARSELRLLKEREAGLAAELETATAERNALREQLALAGELEARMMRAEQSALSDRKSASEHERELSVSRETLRLTSGELDESRHSEEALRAAVGALKVELSTTRERLASTGKLVEAWKARAAADRAIAAEVKTLKLEAGND